MQDYHARLENLRGRLLASGYDQWAMELWSAERSSSMSMEALYNTGVVLKRLIDSNEPDLGDFRDEAQTIYDEGENLWFGFEKAP